MGFVLLPADFISMGPFFSVRSFAKPGFPALVLSMVAIGSSTLLQSHARSESSPPTVGLQRYDLMILVSDLLHLDFFLFLQSFAHLGSSLSVLDPNHLGSFLPVRSFVRLGLSLLAEGTLQLPSTLLTFDGVHVDSPSFLQSCTCFELLASVLDFLHLGSVLPLHSFAHLELPMFVLKCTSLELMLPIRSYARLGFHFLSTGLARLDFSPSAFDYAAIDPSLFIRSFSKLALAMSTPSFVGMDLSLSLRSSACMGPATLTLGLACLSSILSVSWPVHLGSCTPVDNLAQTEIALFAVDLVELGFPLLPHSYAHPASMASSLDFIHVESTLPLRQSSCLDSFLPVSGMVCMDFPSFVLDSAHMGLSSFLHSFS